MDGLPPERVADGQHQFAHLRPRRNRAGAAPAARSSGTFELQHGKVALVGQQQGRAPNSRRSFRTTRISVACPTTWKFDTTIPSGDRITPDPSDDCTLRRGWSRKSPNRSLRSGSPMNGLRRRSEYAGRAQRKCCRTRPVPHLDHRHEAERSIFRLRSPAHAACANMRAASWSPGTNEAARLRIRGLAAGARQPMPSPAPARSTGDCSPRCSTTLTWRPRVRPMVLRWTFAT